MKTLWSLEKRKENYPEDYLIVCVSGNSSVEVPGKVMVTCWRNGLNACSRSNSAKSTKSYMMILSQETSGRGKNEDFYSKYNEE